jgi:hypothetical protein
MAAPLSDPITTANPKYRSKTAYTIPLDQADDVIRASSYHRRDFDLAVIWFPPRTHSNSVASISSVIREPKTSLGELDRLPLELINEICLHLDIKSLLGLRQTNVRARHVVNALHEYQIITTHAVNPLCALLRTGLASRVTLSHFYRLFCTQICSLCNDQYGDLVYLPLWIRCCSPCVRRRDSRLCIATLATVNRVLHLTKHSLAQLPALTTLPGIYTMDERPVSSRMTIVPMHSALAAFGKENAGTEPKQDMIDGLDTRPALIFMACCALPSYNLRTKHIENGVSCAGCQLGPVTGTISETGVGGCVARDRVYSRDDFMKHFEWCEQAQALWLESKAGTIEPPSLPDKCKKGGYFRPRE